MAITSKFPDWNLIKLGYNADVSFSLVKDILIRKNETTAYIPI